MKYELLKSTLECFNEEALNELNNHVFGSGDQNTAHFVEEYLSRFGIKDYILIITGGMYECAIENRDGVICIQKPIHASSVHVKPGSEMYNTAGFIIDFNSLVKSRVFDDDLADEIENELYNSIMSIVNGESSTEDERKRLIKYLESIDFYSEMMEKVINDDFVDRIHPLASKNRIYLNWVRD